MIVAGPLGAGAALLAVAAAPGGVGETVVSGSLLVAIPLAGAAGLLSFASPCVLPLVPGYLSYVTGLTAAELGPAAPLDQAAAAPAHAGAGGPSAVRAPVGGLLAAQAVARPANPRRIAKPEPCRWGV